jgi:glycosidase
VQEYSVAEWMGGNEGLAKLRSRLAERGIGLILDFVPNHTARDHSWVTSHPEYYVGSDPIEFGRDPGYPGWTDTAQLNPNHPAAREAMIRTLEQIATVSDGVRCDMAMLVLQSVFARTWGPKALPAGVAPAPGEFWADAIARVRKGSPDFLFVAETYWNMEWDLQQLGFDYTYDKTMYDRLLREGAGAVRDHLRAEMEYQRHSLRFIENHDEPRAAHALSSITRRRRRLRRFPGWSCSTKGSSRGAA